MKAFQRPTFVAEALEPRRLLAASFVSTIDNPLMPLSPGATWLYRGTADGVAQKNRVVVQSYTETISGVVCTVVLDRVYELEDDEWVLIEKTHDFYAQDTDGNVWYFGEDSRDYEDGIIVSRAGSWKDGVDGATRGIIMEANPLIGDSYEQENSPGVAEDEATVLSLHKRISVPLGTYKNCLQTSETTPLEPDFEEHKFYASGIGVVKTQSVAGEIEVLKLVEYIA
jgi:hypothetical protein